MSAILGFTGRSEAREVRSVSTRMTPTLAGAPSPVLEIPQESPTTPSMTMAVMMMATSDLSGEARTAIAYSLKPSRHNRPSSP